MTPRAWDRRKFRSQGGGCDSAGVNLRKFRSQGAGCDSAGVNRRKFRSQGGECDSAGVNLRKFRSQGGGCDFAGVNLRKFRSQGAGCDSAGVGSGYFSPVYMRQMPRVKALWVTARKPALRIVAKNAILPGKAATEAGR